MPNSPDLTPTPESDTKPRPTLVYGWPGGDLAFAPLDEARLYATLRSGEGFPMTWGEFRSRFGEETYEECVWPLGDGTNYASFDEYLQAVFDGEWVYEIGAAPIDLYDWAEWYRTYPGRRLNSLGFRTCFEYCVAVLAEPDRELAARELRAWFTWSTARGLVEGDEFGTFEQSVRSYRDKLLERVRNEYYDLPIGDDGRPAEDTDIAEFRDSEGNEIGDKPTDISYWPAQRMLDWFPEEVADEYGRVVDSVHDGEFLELETERWEEIVAALEALGFPCVEDNALMIFASGY